LRDVAGVQVGHRRHLQQFHRADDLATQDLDRPVDARPAPRHQPVQVGASDEGEARAERQRGDHVRAVHDAGVERDLDLVPDRRDHVRQQVERHRRPVELPPAVVGQHDAVDPEIGEDLRVGHVLHALDDELAGPHRPDHVQVAEADRRIHRLVQQLAHGAAGGGQRGELELRRGQEVVPPPRPRHGVEHGAQRELRRDREAVARVAQPRSRDRRVDGEEQGVEPGGRGAAREVVGDLPVTHDVQLEPVPAVWVGGADVLDGRRAERGQRERDSGGAGRGGAGPFALGVHEPGEPGRRDPERQG
jgi:hypothetical protein